MEISVELKYGSPEMVYVENEWYDGPRAGIADINGLPHRFKSLFDEKEDEYLGTFLVWPIEKQAADLEIEQWKIFVEWNLLYEAGKASLDSHPGHGGRSKRWDELEVVLRASRSEVPADAKRALAQLTHIDGQARYESTGPGYMLAWSLL